MKNVYIYSASLALSVYHVICVMRVIRTRMIFILVCCFHGVETFLTYVSV